MESKPQPPSVIARLMGLDELPPKQHVSKAHPVLSENYLRKSASIGLLKERSYREIRSFKVKDENGQELISGLGVPETPITHSHYIPSIQEAKANSNTTEVNKSFVEVLKYLNASSGSKGEKSWNSERTTARRKILRSLQKLENGSDHTHHEFKDNIKKDDTRHSRIVVLKPNLGKAQNTARPSVSPISQGVSLPCDIKQGEFSRPKIVEMHDQIGELTVNMTSTHESDVKKPYSPTFFDWKNRCQTSSRSLSGSSFAKQAKKGLFERWKMNKSFQEVGGTGKGTTLGEILAKPDHETRPWDLNYELETSEPSNTFSLNDGDGDLGGPFSISSRDGWNEESAKSLSRSESLPDSCITIENTRCRTGNKAEEQQSEPVAHILFVTDEDSSHILDAYVEKESSSRNREELLVPSSCSGTDHPEFSVNLGESYSPSPNSVLEPPFDDENSCSSNRLKGVGAELHGLRMQLQLLKSESEETNSEGRGMVVSSDEDIGDGSVDFSQESRKLGEFFSAEESRDFSYLVDLLDEAGFQGSTTYLGFKKWYSPKSPLNPSVFETLEKKYGDQTPWEKSERKLLFDCINLGLKEILQPCTDVLTWAKPVRKMFNLSQSREVVEEELWEFLVSQGKDVSKDLSEKAMGTETSWFDLRDDIDLIVCEIERFLFDELVAELASKESL